MSHKQEVIPLSSPGLPPVSPPPLVTSREGQGKSGFFSGNSPRPQPEPWVVLDDAPLFRIAFSLSYCPPALGLHLHAQGSGAFCGFLWLS